MNTITITKKTYKNRFMMGGDLKNPQGTIKVWSTRVFALAKKKRFCESLSLMEINSKSI